MSGFIHIIDWDRNARESDVPITLTKEEYYSLLLREVSKIYLAALDKIRKAVSKNCEICFVEIGERKFEWNE